MSSSLEFFLHCYFFCEKAKVQTWEMYVFWRFVTETSRLQVMLIVITQIAFPLQHN